MSKQAEDLLFRNLKAASSLIEKEKYKKALEKLDKAEKLTEKTNRPYFQLLVLLNKGATLILMGKPDEGQALYDKALDILRASDLIEDCLDRQSTLSNTFNELAELFKNKGRMEDAKACYMNKIKGYEILLKKDPEDAESEMGIASTLDAIGDLYEYFEPDEMDPETAVDYYEKIWDVREKAFELMPESDTYTYDLARALGKLVDLHVMQQDYKTAIQLQERVVEVLEELYDILANWRDLRAKARAYDKLGALYAKVGEVGLEEQHYSKVLEYYEMIFEEDIWEFSIKIMLLAEIMERGKTLLLSEKYESAEESMGVAFDFLDNLDEEEVDIVELEDSGYLEKIAEISRAYAETLSDLGKPEEAKKFAVKSENILRKFAAD